jgi:hypothetical protein
MEQYKWYLIAGSVIAHGLGLAYIISGHVKTKPGPKRGQKKFIMFCRSCEGPRAFAPDQKSGYRCETCNCKNSGK